MRTKENKKGNNIPEFLSATSGDTKGEIDLHWEPVKNAKSYVIQLTPDPRSLSKWMHIDIITSSSYKVPGLKSRSVYGFRVAAIGAAGQSQWSKVTIKKAP